MHKELEKVFYKMYQKMCLLYVSFIYIAYYRLKRKIIIAFVNKIRFENIYNSILHALLIKEIYL